MTQAFNLALLANAVDTSGKLNVGTNATGTLPVANGGTGLTATPTNGQLDIGNGSGFTRATLTQGSGISITNGAGSITIAATGSGTVTSVATGNGLSGGTITTTGTLVIACPGFNTVGSYTLGIINPVSTNFQPASGGTIAAGGGSGQLQSSGWGSVDSSFGNWSPGASNNLSGTWRNMGQGMPFNAGGDRHWQTLFCRVS